MTLESFNNLQEGDLVRHKNDPHAFRVIHIEYDAKGNSTKAVVMRTMTLSNPPEWVLVAKNDNRMVQDDE